VVTASTANLARNATQITINGAGFDPTATNNTVTFSNGAVGTVAMASTTSLTVTFSKNPTPGGPLTAVVTVGGFKSAEVQVATPPTDTQTTSFTAPTSPIPFAANELVTLSATGGGSRSPVVFSIDPSSTGKGIISGNFLIVTGVGTIVVDANQAGDT